MRAPLLALSALLLSTLPGQAGADHSRKQLADPEIRQVISKKGRGAVWRALVGVDRSRPYLVIELLRRDRVVRQVRFGHVDLGDHHLPLSNVRALRDLRWRGRGLDFVAAGSHHGDLRCRLELRRRLSAPSCVQRHQAPPPTSTPPPPEEPGGSSDPAIIRACGDVFTGAASERACVETLRRARRPKAILEQCDRAMSGDRNELACLRAAARGRGPVAKTIERCERAMEGDKSELACVEIAAPDPRAPAMVEACERAMEGDRNELQCVRLARRSYGDVAEVIEACEQSASGDSDELACIQSATAQRRRR